MSYSPEISEKCPRCGNELTCLYIGDRSHTSHEFTWLHICKNKCGYREKFTSSKTEPLGNNQSDCCPSKAHEHY